MLTCSQTKIIFITIVQCRDVVLSCKWPEFGLGRLLVGSLKHNTTQSQSVMIFKTSLKTIQGSKTKEGLERSSRYKIVDCVLGSSQGPELT